MRALSRLNALKHLKISIQSNQQLDLAPVSNVIPESPHRLLSQLWDAFFNYDPTSELVTITLRFWRWEEGNSLPRNESKRVRMKQILYVGSKPNDEFKILVHGKSDKVNVYSVRFPDCDGIL